MAQPRGQPDVFWVRVRQAGLLPQDVDDGADAPKGEAAVAAVAGGGRPGRADVVVGEPIGQGVVGVGAEDA